MTNQERLIASITRRPFRRSATSAETYQDIVNKVRLAESTHMPLQFSVPFGAYKHHLAPMAPHINWAEIFWFDYLTQYANAIQQHVYWLHPTANTPAVVIAFTYTSGVLSFINGGHAELQAQIYREEFARLCQHASTAQVKFELIDIAAKMGGPTQALAKVEQAYKALKSNPHPPRISEAQFKSASRNVLTHPAAEHQIIDAALRCMAMESMDERRALNKYGQHIQLTHIKGTLALHIGSCRSATVQPWIGVGVVENNIPRIVSANAFNLSQWQTLPEHPFTAALHPPGTWPGLTETFVALPA